MNNNLKKKNKFLRYFVLMLFKVLLLKGALLAVEGKILQVKNEKYFFLSFSTKDGITMKAKVYLYNAKDYSAKTRQLLAVLTVLKIMENYSVAYVSGVFDKKYLEKNPKALFSAIPVYPPPKMIENKEKKSTSKPITPKGSILLNFNYATASPIRLNQYMPEEVMTEPTDSIKEDYDKELESTSFIRVAAYGDLYPVSFFNNAVIGKIMGLSFSYAQNITALKIQLPQQIYTVANAGTAVDEDTLEETVKTSTTKVGINFRLPLVLRSTGTYLGTVLKIDLIDKFVFNAQESSVEEDDRDLRSMSFNFYTVRLEENVKFLNYFWLRMGGGVSVISDGEVEPSEILVDDDPVEIGYQSFSKWEWFTSLGVEFKRIVVHLRYDMVKYSAVANDDNFETQIKFSYIGLDIGYLF